MCRANAAQTIRKNFEWNPTFEWVAHRSVVLAARLSGCRVSWGIGDPSVQVLGLSCDGAPPAKSQNSGVSFRFHVIVMNIVMGRTN